MPEPDNTPDDFPPEQFELIAFCDACGHSAAIDRAKIPPGLTIPELPARLRCTLAGCSPRCQYRVDEGTGVRPCACYNNALRQCSDRAWLAGEHAARRAPLAISCAARTQAALC